MRTLAPPPAIDVAPRKIDPRGNQNFWRALDAVAADARRERREFYTFDEWDFLFRTIERDVLEGRGFPALLQPALARKHREIEEYRARGCGPEQLFADDELRARREAERRAQREIDNKARHAVAKIARKRFRTSDA